MKKIDYSILVNIPLYETGFLSNSSIALIDFLHNNKINTVFELIYVIGRGSYKISTYTDTMIEIKGLIDMIKCKYLDIPLVADIYLKNPITKSTFDIYGIDHIMLGILGINGKKTNIYSAITRLGFNDKERDIILDRTESFLINKKLIDIFVLIYRQISRQREKSDEDVVFSNKLLFYINYCKKKNIVKETLVEEVSKVEENSKQLTSDEVALLEEFTKLLQIKDEIDMTVDIFQKKLLDAGIIKRGIKK